MAQTIDIGWKPVPVPNLGGDAFLGYSSKLIDNSTSLLDNLVKQRQADAQLAYNKENDNLNRMLKGYEVLGNFDQKDKELQQNADQFAEKMIIEKMNAESNQIKAKADLLAAQKKNPPSATELALLAKLRRDEIKEQQADEKIQQEQDRLSLQSMNTAVDNYFKDYNESNSSDVIKVMTDDAFMKQLFYKDRQQYDRISNAYKQADSTTKAIMASNLFGNHWYNDMTGNGYKAWYNITLPAFFNNYAITEAMNAGRHAEALANQQARLSGIGFQVVSQKMNEARNLAFREKLETRKNDIINNWSSLNKKQKEFIYNNREAFDDKDFSTKISALYDGTTTTQVPTTTTNTASASQNDGKVTLQSGKQVTSFRAKQSIATDNGHKSK